ncbi:MAG: type III pantothenate kinase [Ruminococcus sp.]
MERVSTNQNATSLELAISIKTILEIYQIQTTEIEGCIISSVVPSINHAVRKAVEKIAHCPVLLVGPGVKTGLQIAIDNPAQLGSDRVADAVAALHEYQPPIVIIDMGTATTLFVIDGQRRHIGGMIAPGVGISMNALTEKTAQLPKISLDPPKRCIGSNTVECMKAVFSTVQPAALTGCWIASRRNWAKHLPFSPPAGCRSSSFPTAGTRSYWTTCFC